MVTSPNEWKILEWDEKPSNTPLPQNNCNPFDKKTSQFCIRHYDTFLATINCFNLFLFFLFHRPLIFSLFDIFMWSNSYQLKLNPFKWIPLWSHDALTISLFD